MTADRSTVPEGAMAVAVEAASGSYEVLVGHGLLDRLATVWSPAGAAVMVVSDDAVAPLYLDRVVAALQVGAGAPRTVSTVVVPAGERHKSQDTLTLLYERLYDAGLGRSDALVALGGGVIGDLAGFAAATFLRGLRLVQVPTTLLAMVDAAVGGKVAVDFREGKNYLGTFYQPELVVEDLDTLATLAPREVRNGWAEMVKHAFLVGGEVLNATERALTEDDSRPAWSVVQDSMPLAADPRVAGAVLPDAALVAASVRLKAAVVARDERERTGRRAVLNLGHTIGHAIEAAGGFERYSHGEAVGLGLRATLWLSERTGRLPAGEAARGQRLVDLAGLPARLDGLAPDDVVRLISRDKKAVGGRSRHVLLEGLGQPVTGNEIDPGLEEEAVRWLTAR